MLIDRATIHNTLKDVTITGVLHIGAHDCEEMPFYVHELGIDPSKIYWIEAIGFKVYEALKFVPNVYEAIITDKDDEPVVFHISNNFQSSSILELKTHLVEHPDVYYMHSFPAKTITVDTFLKRQDIDPTGLNFWNIDIQGCELKALMGARESLCHADVLYLEVNDKELYEGVALTAEVDEFLAAYGFKRVVTKMTVHGWGDAIYKRQGATFSAKDIFA